MKNYCKQNLIQLKNMLCYLDEKAYTHHSQWLSGASIGQHIRHILEFYLCLLKATKTAVVNYDKRERNLLLENCPNAAIETIYEIGEQLERLNMENLLFLDADFSSNQVLLEKISTSYERELAYCLEHSVHHQALIKVGLKEQQLDHLINADFGVAATTIKYHNKSFVDSH